MTQLKHASNPMLTKLINPFRFIAGFRALAAGVLVILVTAVLAYFSNTHFPDILSVKISGDLPFWFLVSQGAGNWFIVSVVLYLTAVIASPSSVRLVDIFGTQALARFPYLPAAGIGFFGSVEKFGQYVLWENLGMGDGPVAMAGWEMGFAILLMMLTILLSIWLVALMYNAFKISANLKGAKSGGLFILGFIVSIVLTRLFSNYLLAGLV
ncbi:MAG: hypothetical protein K9N46_00380 [Candidatus Marinimicrobia bacterium]|nr:hypothetical protein [Candidatus Neomarinimicrobiota bacterium]MCF7829861.1 hypothetical protein [Candidatus Neomarinimicrobiota bacterium]MCF7879176.1 hypothetical protein [Candidatus Neomarinimicrobiota bacterium]